MNNNLSVTPIKLNYAYRKGKEFIKSVSYNRWGKTVTVETIKIGSTLTSRKKELSKDGALLRTVLDVFNKYGKRINQYDI